MKQLPTPEVYEQEYKYMPWGKTIGRVLAEVKKNTPRNGKVLDLMCGPGYLLDALNKVRPDLELHGLDVDRRYVKFGRERNKNVQYHEGNALNTAPLLLGYNTLVCTGGMHHISYTNQELLIESITRKLLPDGMAILADPYVSDYRCERQRQLAASELGREYLDETIRRGAPQSVILAAIDVMYNDVIGYEYKTSVPKAMSVFRRHFKEVIPVKIWPQNPDMSSYGDYVFLLKEPKNE